MTPDQVIKEAIEKIARTRYDAFLLGALGTFKEAGATDEEAMELVKVGASLPPALAKAVGSPLFGTGVGAVAGGTIGAVAPGRNRKQGDGVFQATGDKRSRLRGLLEGILAGAAGGSLAQHGSKLIYA